MRNSMESYGSGGIYERFVGNEPFHYKKVEFLMVGTDFLQYDYSSVSSSFWYSKMSPG